MEDRVHPLASLEARGHVLDIRLQKLRVVLQLLQVLMFTVREIVEDFDGVPSRKEAPHQV